METTAKILNSLIIIIGYLMPIPLAYLAINFWRHYRNEIFISGIKWVLLEIQVPREMNKSPKAMELVFSNAFYHKSNKGFWDLYVAGAVWLWFSLEIVSIDGRVRFFIRTPTRIRNLVETQIYAQFPQAKVVETEDYVFHVPKITKKGNWHMWGCEFAKEKHDAYPIKTYQDWGDEMKTGQKEEFKLDPLTPTIEFLGSISKGEQIWIQIIVRQSVKEYKSERLKKKVNIDVAITDEIYRLTAPFTRAQGQEDDPTKSTFALDMRTPELIKNTVAEMLRHADHLHFDCGIRLIILARKDLVKEETFNNTKRSARLLFRQFAMPSSNQLERLNSPGFDFTWKDPLGTTSNKLKNRLVSFYRNRTFFHPPIEYAIKYFQLISFFFPSGKPEVFVLSAEELATLFHFPGMVSETPTFRRVESKIAKPPSNLPS